MGQTLCKPNDMTYEEWMCELMCGSVEEDDEDEEDEDEGV